jgi:Ice-binding-like/Bacterial Ig-like domain
MTPSALKSICPLIGLALLTLSIAAACGDSGDGKSPTDDGGTTSPSDGGDTIGSPTTDTTPPRVLSNVPAAGALAVATNRVVGVIFSEAMNPNTLTTMSFTILGPDSTVVSGTVTYSGIRATFKPLSALSANTLFRVTITTAATDLAGNALSSNFQWSFTTGASAALGPSPVLLGVAGGFVILAKSGIDTVPASAVTGNIGVSPIDSTAITGFSLAVDASNGFATSGQVSGKVFAADYASPTPANLTTAVSNMEAAYTDAAGRITPDYTELGAGEIGGRTLVPGLYKWGTGVSISSNVTLSGGPNDVWIFQIAGDVTQANGTTVTLSGGASPHNIFWQTFGKIMIGTTAHFEGIVLCQTAIILGTGASVNGRLLAQTAVTLDQSRVVQPTSPSP